MATWTNEQLRDFEARRYSSNHIQKVLSDPVEDESGLHNAIIDYCKSKGWQYLHGSMAHRTRRVCGEPDFVVLAHGSQLRMVECKSKNGKLSLDQQAFIAHAKKNGHVVYVVRSMEEFVKLFC
jgi:hypothetical protein